MLGHAFKSRGKIRSLPASTKIQQDPPLPLLEAGLHNSKRVLRTTLDQIKDLKKLPHERLFAIVLLSDFAEGGSRQKREEFLDELNKKGFPLFTVVLSDSLIHPEQRAEFANEGIHEALRATSSLFSAGFGRLRIFSPQRLERQTATRRDVERSNG